MSLILNGIDLPENNLRVICLYPHGAEELVVLDADSGATAGRPIDVIQIPKGHGRLIDITAYKKESAMQDYTCEGCPNENKCIYHEYTGRDICEWLDDAPTILEAE